MKRNFIAECIILMMIISLIAMCHDRKSEEEMMVYNSSAFTMGECHNERIVVIVNQRKISDKQKYAERIVEKCRENNFKNVRFSYDLSKPNELDIIVCRNEKEADEGRWDFRFRYVQKVGKGQYNIIDHPEKFRIEILHED